VKVYICDTNNHCIRTCYYDVGQVSTLVLKGVPPASVEFHERNVVGEISAKKREAAKGGSENTNLKCEGD
jgi:hypothetical protein